MFVNTREAKLPAGVPVWSRARVLAGMPADTHPPLPLTLITPEFGVISDLADAEPPQDVAAEELAAVHKACSNFLDAVCSLHERERERNEAARQPLRQLLNHLLVERESDSAAHATVTDGSGSVMTAGGADMFLVNLELNENRPHQHAELQNICYYLQHYFPRDAKRKGRAGLPGGLPGDLALAPALLLNMYGGSVLTVHGVAITRTAVLSECLATASLLAPPGSRQRQRLVHMMLGVRRGLGALRARYESAATTTELCAPVLGDPPQTLLPSTLTLDSGEVCRIAYGPGLMKNRLVYSAAPVALPAAGSAPAPAAAIPPWCVKFCRTYGAAAHAAAAAEGVAPRLRGCAHLPGGWIAVIMDNVLAAAGADRGSGSRWAHFDHNHSGQVSAVLDAWQRGVERHGNVHGDVRSPNILVRERGMIAAACGGTGAGGAGAAHASALPCEGGWEVQIVDWEWAGPAGKVNYPHTRNPALEWPSTSTAGGPIMVEHDRECIVGKCP